MTGFSAIHRTVFATMTIALLHLPAPKAHAWGDLGHQVIGEIAERILTDSDRTTLGAVQSVIGIEPLQVAATWPDKVRDDQRFDPFAPYHFATIFRDPSKHAEQDINTVFTKYPSIVTDSSLSVAERAIALRFIIHMVGDAHQPLHVGNEFDHGANACMVMLMRGTKNSGFITNLHKAWDTDIPNEMVDEWKKQYPNIKYFGARDTAKLLMEKYPELMMGPVAADPAIWVREAAEMRKNGGVYPDQLPDDARPYCSTKKDAPQPKPEELPKLGAAYYSASRALIEKQLVKGGVRLAAFLKAVFKDRAPSTPVDEKKILLDLQKRNDPPANRK